MTATEVPDVKLEHIRYSSKRMRVLADDMKSADQMTEDHMKNILTTKYSHWRYEQEVRVYSGLDPIDDNGFSFSDFGSKLELKRVIVGARSLITRAMIAEALGGLSAGVKTYKARASFKSFRIVRNKDETLWA
ncbi:MAG: hypothetical protein BMS9Abin26_0427 [Gammaproteobacteria bacterium]|nr:MAG: hypothetical protein BMS9Abin26_0427 [Gammaproteobacteria bacterium]